MQFEVLETENAFRLLGPEMSYHRVDPYLNDALRKLGVNTTPTDVLDFTSTQTDFDFCFEDSWTGYFIASRFGRQSSPRELVLIHLDDHTDMMATLLCRSGENLMDPTSGGAFDPTSTSAWRSAIYSGAVNIGNYITPLFYSGCKLHVRHLNNSKEDAQLAYVSRASRKHELIRDRQFADIRRSTSEPGESVGTYLGGSNPETVLNGVPRAWTLLHIDLDYFINDFNGSSRGPDYLPDAELQKRAQGKMDRFFDALAKLNPGIDRWFVASSPGFCSGYHWEFLVSEIRRRIQGFNEARKDHGDPR